ncbi:hemerythrin domain-containing protein [Aquibium microcysteis]|uniref:hemerythrin domain-containing protein n=1 Tax=Aquibium microcysteis TaxID=675281 RepID=UPI001EF2018E|nr:hemerythrin domain-containing protein [Aquibium microcysteis]
MDACEVPQTCPVSGACGRDGLVPCVEMTKAHHSKLRLCEALEDIADRLPGDVDRFRCLEIASALVPLLRRCHDYEEEVVYPAFEAAHARAAGSLATVSRLRAEHVEDECAAQDLSEVLLSIGHGEAVRNPEAVGFMLRAFFEAVRRHVAFERDHVLPAIGVLTDEWPADVRTGARRRP